MAFHCRLSDVNGSDTSLTSNQLVFSPLRRSTTRAIELNTRGMEKVLKIYYVINFHFSHLDGSERDVPGVWDIDKSIQWCPPLLCTRDTNERKICYIPNVSLHILNFGVWKKESERLKLRKTFTLNYSVTWLSCESSVPTRTAYRVQ